MGWVGVGGWALEAERAPRKAWSHQTGSRDRSRQSQVRAWGAMGERRRGKWEGAWWAPLMGLDFLPSGVKMPFQMSSRTSALAPPPQGRLGG